MDDFDDIQCEEVYNEAEWELINDPTTYEEYQDLPWGGDDQFETCNFCEDF
jgi:hypothetical protein